MPMTSDGKDPFSSVPNQGTVQKSEAVTTEDSLNPSDNKIQMESQELRDWLTKQLGEVSDDPESMEAYLSIYSPDFGQVRYCEDSDISFFNEQLCDFLRENTWARKRYNNALNKFFVDAHIKNGEEEVEVKVARVRSFENRLQEVFLSSVTPQVDYIVFNQLGIRDRFGTIEELASSLLINGQTDTFFEIGLSNEEIVNLDTVIGNLPIDVCSRLAVKLIRGT